MIPIPEPKPKPDPIIFSNTRTRSDPKLKNPTRQPLCGAAAGPDIIPWSGPGRSRFRSRYCLACPVLIFSFLPLSPHIISPLPLPLFLSPQHFYGESFKPHTHSSLQVMSPIFSFEDKFSLPSADFEKCYFYSGQLMDRRIQANNNELPVYLAKSFCNYYVYSPREAIA